jgi:hydroxymethylbilane synthase
VCARLREAHPDLETTETIITTHGDVAVDRPFDADWPVGSFVGALESALAASEIDLAVHSFKDLPSASPPSLVVAAVPVREAPNDVHVVREPVKIDDLPAGFRVGTSSPRRSAQFRRLGDVEIVPIRGNVPTRVNKMEAGDYDGVILAAAGLRRLGIEPPHVVDLPPQRFVPSPAQGALAIQTRIEGPAAEIARAIEDPPSRRAVDAERAFLAHVEAGCQTPLGAWATVDGESITLRAQLFSDDGLRLVEGVERGEDAVEIGARLGARLLAELRAES